MRFWAEGRYSPFFFLASSAFLDLEKVIFRKTFGCSHRRRMEGPLFERNRVKNSQVIPRVGGRAHKIFRTGVSPGLFWDWQNLQKFWNGYDAHSKTTYPWGFQKGGNPPLSGIRKILCTLPLGRGCSLTVKRSDGRYTLGVVLGAK